MEERKINTAKMATLLAELRRQGKIVEAWAAGDGASLELGRPQMTHLIAAVGFVLALMLLNSEKARAQADSSDTVQALYSNCRETADPYHNDICSGFIEGIAAMMSWDGCQGTQTPTHGAMVQAFQNWAATHPQAWSQSKVNGVVTALRATWPCARPPRH